MWKLIKSAWALIVILATLIGIFYIPADVDSAEEITAQVFVHLIERIDKYRISPVDNVAIFSAWLYRMSYNKMVDGDD